MRAFALLVFLLFAGPVFAQSVKIGPESAPGSAPFTAIGGTAAQSPATREGQRLSIFDFANIYANTQVVTEAATINSGTPTTLTVASNTFAPGDVGKYIVVPFAGSAISWLGGSVTSVPVATNGSAYTAVPTVSFSGSPLSTALAQPLLQLTAVAANNSGTGCTAGTYSETVAGGKFNTGAAVLSVTIGGGGTVSAVSVGSPVGDYFVLPTLTANTAGAAIPGCSVQPTFNLTMNVASVYVQWGGNGYSLTPGAVTATLSGGSPGTAATLGTVLTSQFTAPLATTIASYVSPTQVTLTTGASSFLSTQSVRIVWGNDDCAGINAAIAVLPANSALRFPHANYGCATSFVWGSEPLKIEGDGNYESTIYALAPTTSVFNKNTTFTNGSVVRDVTFDGSDLAQFTCYFQSGYQFVVENIYCLNAATPTASGAGNYSANLAVGDGTHLLEQIHFVAPYARSDGGLYSGSGDLPTYGIWVQATDNAFVDPVEVNNTQANFRVEAAANDTWITNSHSWGSEPASISLAYVAKNCMELAGSSWVTEPGCDIARGDGVYVNTSIVHGFGGHLLGSQVQSSGGLSGAQGLEIAGSLDSVVWFGYDAGTIISGGNRVVFDTPYPTHSYVWAGTKVGQQRVDLGDQNTTSTNTLYGVCAGSFNACNGVNSYVAAENAVSTGTATSLFGANTSDYGVEAAFVNGYGEFGTTKGSAESFDMTVSGQTTDGTTTVPLVTNTGGSVGNYNQIPVPTLSGLSYTSISCRLTFSGVAALGATAGATAMWTADNVLFKNVSGTISQVGSTAWTKQQGDTGASSWNTPAMSADNTNKAIAQTIIGVASTTINWTERAHCVVN